MKKFEKVFKTRAFRISLFYVGLGTLSVCSIYPKDLFYGEWSQYGLILTFPVCIISFGYRYAASNLLYPVFGIQLIMFFFNFFYLEFINEKKKKRK